MNKKLLLLGLIPTLILTSCGSKPDDSGKSITFNRETLSLAIEDTYQVKANYVGFANEEISLVAWSSANNAIATVEAGLVTGISEGTTTISASFEKVSASLSVSVFSTGEVATFSILEEQEVYIGTDLTFNEATAYKGELVDATYTYASDNTEVVSVNGSTVTAVGEGVAHVTITSQYKTFTNTAIATVNVIPSVEIILDNEKVTLAPATYDGTKYIKEITLNARAYINNELSTAPITWESDDTNIATVNNGVVKGVNEGETKVAAIISHNGKQYAKTATISVKTPTIYIDATITVNMLNTLKVLDLIPYGVNVALIEKVELLNEGSWENVPFTLQDNKLVLTINDSLYNTTHDMRVEIDGEYTMFKVAFKDFIEHKVFFADAPSHTADIEALGDVQVSYDASKVLPLDDVKNPDKDRFANEIGGTIKVEMTGKNEDLIHLKSASLLDLSEYDYLVYYVYSNYDGYFGSAKVTETMPIKANQWNRIVIKDFSAVLKMNGRSILDDNYDPTGMIFRFTNNRQPSKKAVMWMSSVYAGVTPRNRVISFEASGGSNSTSWWINGGLIVNAGYEDYYAHYEANVEINVDDLAPQDLDYFKHEINGCLVVNYAGDGSDIEAHYFAGHPLQGYTDLVFYIYVDAPEATEMYAFTRQRLRCSENFVPGHWNRVHMDLEGLKVASHYGTLHTEVDNLDGWFFGVYIPDEVYPKAETKFYVTSIYGFNY